MTNEAIGALRAPALNPNTRASTGVGPLYQYAGRSAGISRAESWQTNPGAMWELRPGSVEDAAVSAMRSRCEIHPQ